MGPEAPLVSEGLSKELCFEVSALESKADRVPSSGALPSNELHRAEHCTSDIPELDIGALVKEFDEAFALVTTMALPCKPRRRITKKKKLEEAAEAVMTSMRKRRWRMTGKKSSQQHECARLK